MSTAYAEGNGGEPDTPVDRALLLDDLQELFTSGDAAILFTQSMQAVLSGTVIKPDRPFQGWQLDIFDVGAARQRCYLLDITFPNHSTLRSCRYAYGPAAGFLCTQEMLMHPVRPTSRNETRVLRRIIADMDFSPATSARRCTELEEQFYRGGNTLEISASLAIREQPALRGIVELCAEHRMYLEKVNGVPFNPSLVPKQHPHQPFAG